MLLSESAFDPISTMLESSHLQAYSPLKVTLTPSVVIVQRIYKAEIPSLIES